MGVECGCDSVGRRDFVGMGSTGVCEGVRVVSGV